MKKTTVRYCSMCGNAKVRSRAPIAICRECRGILRSQLAVAFFLWVEAGQRYRQCCGGLSTDKTHLHFHGKYFDAVYPDCPLDQPDKDRKKYTAWEQSHVTVEYGFSFFKDHAETYFIRDFGNDTDSETFGEIIHYPKTFESKDLKHLTPTGPAWDRFWMRLEHQGGEAAKHAWGSDLLTCAKCGYHYYSPNGPCACEEGEEAEGD